MDIGSSGSVELGWVAIAIVVGDSKVIAACELVGGVVDGVVDCCAVAFDAGAVIIFIVSVFVVVWVTTLESPVSGESVGVIVGVL